MSFASNLTSSCFVVFTAASEPPPFPRPRKQGQVQTKGQPARPLRSPRPAKAGRGLGRGGAARTVASGRRLPTTTWPASRIPGARAQTPRLVPQHIRCRMYNLMYTSPMPKGYSVASARSHLPEILDAVEAGNDVHLSRRGRLVAVVVSTDQYDAYRSSRRTFAAAYRGFLEAYPAGDVGLDPGFVSSLRDRGRGRRVRL